MPASNDYEDLCFELSDGVAVITLNRPERMNAYSGPMGESLGRAYRYCDGDDEVRAVVLTGAGRAFCAGADFADGAAAFEKQDDSSFSAAGVDPPAFALRKPVIAAVNGHAVGIGLTLALQCDIRVMAREGKYGVLQVRRGMMPDAYSHWTLPRIVGLSRAADILLSGRSFGGEEAGDMGLASRVLPADQVLPEAIGIARDIAENAAPLSVAITKRLLWEAQGLSPAQVERRETLLHHHLMGKHDALEGAMAYIEKRSPQWKLTVSGDWPEWPDDDER